jgi:hypothetical protein
MPVHRDRERRCGIAPKPAGDVRKRRIGGGGEYPLQDGFGWTNGVTLKLLDLYAPGE